MQTNGINLIFEAGCEAGDSAISRIGIDMDNLPMPFMTPLHTPRLTLRLKLPAYGNAARDCRVFAWVE